MPRTARPLTPRLLVAFLVTSLLAAGSVAAWAQGTGRITGSVTDRRTGRAIAFVNLAIPEARTGGLSDSKGEFLIPNLAPGTYSVRAQFTGYGPETVAGVVVRAGQTTPLKITMQEIVVKQESTLVVTGQKLVDVKQGGTVRNVKAEDIENQGLQTLTEVVQQQAGVSNENNLIRVRGGRADETTFLIDGLANRNPISGESTAGSVNARSVAEVNVITSGFSARYGQALSGIVDVRLKEGGSQFEGGASAQFGNWFTQYYNGAIGGPDWLTGTLAKAGLHLPGEATYLLDVSADFTNTYYPNIQDLPGRPRIRSGYEEKFLWMTLDYGSEWAQNWLMPAEENTWRALYKWTWKPSGSKKVDVSFNKRLQFDQGFTRRPIRDLSGQALSYPWDWSKRFDHYGTVTEDVNTFAIDLTQTFNPRTYHSLKLSRFFTSFQYAVNGKTWSEYERPVSDPAYFVTTGDDNQWTHFWTENLGFDYRIGARLGSVHNTEFGFQNMFQNVQYVTIIDPWEYDPDGLGGDHDLWHVYPTMGALYASDRLEYEGFIAEGGIRADYWFPGKQLEDAVADPSNQNISEPTRIAFEEDTGTLFGRKVKAVLSPRVTVSHPIQNRDKLFFNFGQFTQFPSYYYIYSKLTSVSSASFPVLGNANLNPEKSVQFEVGAEHVFQEGLAGKIALFQKDIYDYPTSVRFRRQEGTVISDFFVYINSDFSRARGFELEFEKVRRKYWRYKATYEFAVAKGKSSDPNQAKVVEEGGGDATEQPLSEGFLFWNRPHKLTFNVDFRVGPVGERPRVFGITLPPDCGANLFTQIQSGKAYTPTDPDGNATAKVYSKNGPTELLVNLRLNKDFRIGDGQRLGVSVAGENILGWDIVRRLDGNTGDAPMAGAGQYTNPTQFEYDSVLSNPGNYGPTTRWRLGIDYDF